MHTVYRIRSRTINRTLLTIHVTQSACYLYHSVHGPAAKRGSVRESPEILTRDCAADMIRFARKTGAPVIRTRK